MSYINNKTIFAYLSDKTNLNHKIPVSKEDLNTYRLHIMTKISIFTEIDYNKLKKLAYHYNIKWILCEMFCEIYCYEKILTIMKNYDITKDYYTEHIYSGKLIYFVVKCALQNEENILAEKLLDRYDNNYCNSLLTYCKSCNIFEKMVKKTRNINKSFYIGAAEVTLIEYYSKLYFSRESDRDYYNMVKILLDNGADIRGYRSCIGDTRGSKYIYW